MWVIEYRGYGETIVVCNRMTKKQRDKTMKKYLAVLIACLFVVLPTAAFAATGVGDGIVLEEQSASPFDPEAGKVLLGVDTTYQQK